MSASENNRVDVAVVGGGPIGSAAARHLAESGVTTALLASPEPPDYASSSGPFSSHYDEGRVTRISAFSPQWAELAVRSIERYGDIATRSGVSFHSPVGLAVIAPDAEVARGHGAELGADVRAMDPALLYSRTGIRAPEGGGHMIAYEGPPAGLVNPRLMVRAQAKLVERAGGHVVPAPVEAVRPNGAGVELDVAGSTIQADRILLATGAYGAELVGIDLEIERRLRTIVRAELGPGPLPSLILDDPDHPELDGLYWVPPVRFSNGRTLIKIGGDSLPMEVAGTAADIGPWFNRGGSEVEAEALVASLRSLLPDRTITWHDHRPCVVTYTSTDLPYIGWVDDNVAVAVGGCGAAAKSGDEIGRLAAAIVTDAEWPNSHLPAGLFSPRVR